MSIVYHQTVLDTPIPAPKQPPLYLWPRSEIVERANRWAVSHGWQPMTDQAVLDWKKTGLLPKVGSRSLGRGKGTEGLWGSRAYRQLLRVMQLRASGLRRRRDIRLKLWMEGYEVPWRRVRSDLQSLMGPTIRSANDEMGVDRWPLVPGAGPSPGAIKAIERRLVGPVALPALLKELGLPDLLAEGLARWFQRQEIKDVLIHWTYLLFSPDPRRLQAALHRVTAAIPARWRPLVLPDENLLDMFAGVLSPTWKGDNRAWHASRKGEERLIANLRDFARSFDALWSSSLRVGAVVLRSAPTDLPSWSVPMIAGAMDSLAKLSPLRKTDNEIALAALLLNRRRNLEDQAEPLGVMGRVIPELFNWLADHPEIIQIVQADVKAVEALALAAPLSPEAKALLAGELSFGSPSARPEEADARRH